MLTGYKSYVAAIGLVCLAIYQFTQGDVDHAIQNLLAALAVVGVRHAVSTNFLPALVVGPTVPVGSAGRILVDNGSSVLPSGPSSSVLPSLLCAGVVGWLAWCPAAMAQATGVTPFYQNLVFEQTYAQNDPSFPPAVAWSSAKVVSSHGSGASCGSGTIVYAEGNRGILITARHVISTSNTNVTLVFGDGSKAKGTFLGVDRRGIDLAAILIEAAPGERLIALPVAESNAADGEAIWQCGYPHAGHQVRRKGHVVGMNGSIAGRPVIHADFDIISGDSGSGAFRAKDLALCGVCNWGGGSMMAVPAADINAFVDSPVCCGPFGRWRDRCPGGNCPSPSLPSPSPVAPPMPPKPPGVPPVPSLPPVAPSAAQPDLSAVLARLDAMSGKIDKIQLTPGPQGPKGISGDIGQTGLQGPEGKQGPQGLDGKDAPTVNIAILEQRITALEKRLPATTTRVVTVPVSP